MDSLKRLRLKMGVVNCLFHFTRDNPRSTVCFYNRFISIIGHDKWKEMKENNNYIVNAWESAEYSFDKMYGLVKAWKINGLLDPDENN